jgi:polysaccharide biosynthesis/export protein ExoF
MTIASDLRRHTVLFLIAIVLIGAPDKSFAQTELNYPLGPGDKLLFDFLDEPDPASELMVASDGSIQLPILGVFKVEGLGVQEAVKRINQFYIDREVLLSPTVAITVAEYRPVFVLGDVKEVGSKPFYAYMNVEQALSLAGGPIVAFGSAEDRTMTRVKMEGDLGINTAELTRSSLVAARLSAQIADRVDIKAEDIPEPARPFVDLTNFELLKDGEERLLAVESETMKSELELVDGNLKQTASQIKLLEKLTDNQRRSIKFSEDALKRASDLLAKGLKTAGDVEDNQRQLIADEGRLLSTMSELLQANRIISTLNRERVQIANNARTNAMRVYQEQLANIGRLLAARKSIQTQLALASNFTLADSERQQATTITIKLRRRVEGRLVETEANNQTELQPGDVVTVLVTATEVNQNGVPASANSAAVTNP